MVNKKLICTLLLATMLVTGCSGGSADSSQESSGTSSAPLSSSGEDSSSQQAGPSGWPTVYKEDPEHLEWMDDTSPITLTMFKGEVITDGWNWGDDRVTEYITERTGVKLDVQFAQSSDNNELTLMLASGEKLPDIIATVYPSSIQYNEMIQGDYIHKIDELIDEYCPSMWDLLYPEEIEFSKMEDGHIYYVSRQTQSVSYSNSPYFYMNGHIATRTDILNDLGYKIDEITSTDKWIEVMDAFMARKDEWPEVNYPIYIYQPSLTSGAFDGMFGGETTSSPYRYDMETDTLSYWFESERGLEQLKFWNRMYKEGYLPKNVFTDDFASIVPQGSFLFLLKNNAWEVPANKAAIAENVEGATVSFIAPITNAPDQEWSMAISMVSPMIMPNTVITKDCEHPDRAIRLMEFLKTEEGNLAVTAGIYGEHWELGTDDQGVNYPNPIGEAAQAHFDIAKLNTLGIYNSTKTWIAVDTLYDDIAGYPQRFDEENEEITAGRDLWKPYVKTNLASALPDLVTIESGTTESDIEGNCSDIYENMIIDIILAESEAELQSLYDKMIADINSVGKENLFTILLPKIHDVKASLEASGIVFE